MRPECVKTITLFSLGERKRISETHQNLKEKYKIFLSQTETMRTQEKQNAQEMRGVV